MWFTKKKAAPAPYLKVNLGGRTGIGHHITEVQHLFKGVFNLDASFHERDIRFEITVADQRAYNIHLHDGIDEAEFVRMRTACDATLAMPVLVLPAVQVNIRVGEFPPKDDNGVSYLKIPLNAL
jgi:hypothetical protein